MQAQDLRAARLAIRSRSTGLVASDVDRALDDRSLVVTWLNRGTLHLVRSDDYQWLQALFGPRLEPASLRRVGEVAADRVVAAIERALAEDGPLTRAQLDQRIPLAGQALYHAIRLACVRGIAVRRAEAYVLVRDWLGEPPHIDRDAALAELGRRYLAGHAPADDRDLARWTGLGLRDARVALAAAGESPRPAEELPPPRLLGMFDPVLFGWASREWVLGDLAGHVIAGGMFKAFALREGRAVGTWDAVADDPAFDAERADVERFLTG